MALAARTACWPGCQSLISSAKVGSGLNQLIPPSTPLIGRLESITNTRPVNGVAETLLSKVTRNSSGCGAATTPCSKAKPELLRARRSAAAPMILR